MASRPVLYLIDGHALAYRQFFALPVASFSTRAGEPTNATYGFSRVLMDILQTAKPEYIAVTFDQGMSGRDELYGEYKGTREKMPDELRVQLDRIAQVVQAFNMPVLQLEGYEADDVIGTVALQAEAQGVDVRIVTGDRDILQLLSDHVSVQLPRRNEADVVYNVALFKEEWGIDPLQLIDWKGLVGDTSDNIPGVRGIGEKTATKLLQEFGSLEAIYERLDDIKGANQQKLRDGRDSAFLSKKLATIMRDIPVTLDLQACLSHDYDARQVDELFGALEFRSLRDRLPKASEQLTLFDMGPVGLPSVPSATEAFPTEPVAETVIVQEQAGLEALVAALNTASEIAFDTETTSTDQMAAVLVGISLAVDGERGYYIPVGHEGAEQLPLKTVIDAIRPAMTNSAIPKYAHNAGYDYVMLNRYGIEVHPVGFDTMIAEWLRAPDSKFLGLKNLARQELNVHMTEISTLIGSGKKQITMDKVAVEQAAPYAAADAAVTMRLVHFLRPKLEELNLTTLNETLELPLIPVIAAMEQHGVVLDTRYLKDLSTRMGEMLAKLEDEVISVSGGYGKFNINSPKQLSDMLFGKLGLSTEGVRKTTQGYSTDAAVLESLKGQHPIIDHILEYREISKLRGTYVDALPELINPQTGRVHTSYNQAGAATGRLSSNTPNLQNIPNRTELGLEVRRSFVAPGGMKLLSVDYSQVELRILAHISQDKTLLEAFAQGQDIHAATAAAVYGIPLEQVNKEQRGFAKRVNFGLIYGMGPHRLARDSNLSFNEAKAFIDTYFARLPGVKKYLEDTKQAARKGPIYTLFGRRRVFAVLQSGSTPQAIQAEERVAINMPIQGTAADIMKRAMIDLYNELNRRRMKAKMMLQVHDELVLEVPQDDVLETTDLVVNVMEGAYKLDAPLRANAQVGDNWRDMTKI